MKTLTFENEIDWMAARMGKITGSRVKDVMEKKRGEGKKIGYYELIAERLARPAEDMDPREHGHKNEPIAIARLAEYLEKDVDGSLVMWVSDANPNIAVSPDGVISETEAAEVKCLSAANHIKAYLTQEVPKEYLDQIIQYFIVNEKLEIIHETFYNPDMRVKDFFVITIKRADVLADIESTLIQEQTVLREVDEIVAKLTEF